MGCLLRNDWTIRSHRSPNIKTIANAIGYPPELDRKTLLPKHHTLESLTYKNQAVTHMEDSLLLVSFHSTIRSYTGY